MPTTARTKTSTARSAKARARNAATGSRSRSATQAGAARKKASSGRTASRPGTKTTKRASEKARSRSAAADTRSTKARAAGTKKAGRSPAAAAPKSGRKGAPKAGQGKRANGSGPIHEASAATLKAHAALTPMQGATDLDGHDPETLAFLGGPRARDPVVEEMAMDAVRAATSGEDEIPDPRPGERSYELGGPFVETKIGTEIGYDDSPPNVEDAEPAAAPTTHDVGGPLTRSHGELELEPDVPIARTHGPENEESPEDGYRT